jgi:hypothetical protein
VKKSKITSNPSNDRTNDYANDHFFNGSTGMNIGTRYSPKNYLAKAMDIITRPSMKTDDITYFENNAKDKSAKKIYRNQNMTQ